MASEGSSTPAPTESFTPAPEGSSTPPPEGRSTPAPEGSSSLAPERSSSLAPEGSSSLAPEGSSSLAPEGSSSLAPEGSSSLAPQGSSSLAPEGSSSLALEGSSSLALEGSSSLAPQGSSSLAPQGSSSLAPEGSSSLAPEGSSSLAPEGSSSLAPEGSSSLAPEGSSSLAPEGSSSLAPEGSSRLAPEGSSRLAPEGSSSLAPEGSSSLAPEGSSRLAPEGSSRLAPEGSSRLAPEGSSRLAPEGSCTLALAGSCTLAPAGSCTPTSKCSSTSAPKESFTAVSSSPEWKKGLERLGSCLKLYELLQNRPELIHELGPDGITVLHKGVDHGCVKLVRFVLVDMFNEAGICNCKREKNRLVCALTREGLLRKTTEYGSTAVNMAIVSGSPKMVLLLEWAIRVSSKDKKTVNTIRRTIYPVDTEQYVELLKISGCNNERSEEVEPVVNAGDEVPDVKDDEISKSIYLQEMRWSEKTYDREMQLELYKIIAAKLNERSTGKDGVVLNFLKDKCAKNVDFEFVPVEHIFLHFLISYGLEKLREGHPWEVEEMVLDFLTRFMKDIVEECKMWDKKKKAAETMQMTIFSILDPRGRTITHTLFHKLVTMYDYDYKRRIIRILKAVASESGKRWRCYTAKDGAGRTLYHMPSIYDVGFMFEHAYMEPEHYPHVNIKMTPLCYNEFRALQLWSFEETLVKRLKDVPQIPIYLTVLFNSEEVMRKLLQAHAKEGFLRYTDPLYTPFQMACALGRTKLVEQFLQYQVQFKNIHDGGFDGCKYYNPALHLAATSGQVEVIQMILKYPIFDPMCQNSHGEDTALHAVVGMCSDYTEFEHFKIWALHHVLPNSHRFKRIEGSFLRHEAIKSSPRDFTKNEKICINLLLQAGIDMWTPNKDGEYPNVELKANNEARSWWYEKVVKEVEIKKASITSAANATSVVGALVATTSFIGPLQPPLSYSLEGYVDANPISIRIYLVCNSISFFFSIASILMAVLPSIPMQKESSYEEMIRSERCLKAAITLLLISIICILVSFSSASLAVVSSQWQDRKLIVASMIIGGVVCVVVLVIFIIRLLRMVFHKNSWLRRKFAKHMYF